MLKPELRSVGLPWPTNRFFLPASWLLRRTMMRVQSFFSPRRDDEIRVTGWWAFCCSTYICAMESSTKEALNWQP
jgi:hypothetical protein